MAAEARREFGLRGASVGDDDKAIIAVCQITIHRSLKARAAASLYPQCPAGFVPGLRVPFKSDIEQYQVRSLHSVTEETVYDGQCLRHLTVIDRTAYVDGDQQTGGEVVPAAHILESVPPAPLHPRETALG